VVVVATVVASLALVLGGWAGWSAARDRPVVFRQLLGAGVVEAALVVQMVVAAVGVLGGRALAEAATFWGYLVVALVVLPLAGAWALVERTRWSSVVLVVGCLTVVVMEVRVVQLWNQAVA
jgi:hypothetical protein